MLELPFLVWSIMKPACERGKREKKKTACLHSLWVCGSTENEPGAWGKGAGPDNAISPMHRDLPPAPS